MIQQRLSIKIIFFFLLSLPLSVQAHGGRTDTDGCHFERTTGEYHCHESREWVESYGTIVEVIDGDTFDIDIGGVIQRVHLIGVNAPEWDTSEGQRIKSLFTDQYICKKVRLIHQNVRDKYIRLLAKVYVDNKDIAKKVVAFLKE